MQKFEGIHFYVNVANFNEVVIDEEMKSDKVNHAIHALDTFFKSIESFGKKNFPEKFVVEKITGARLHMYVVDDIDKAYDIVEEVVEFTGNLAKYLNNNIAKYKTLQGFKVQVGACFGRFCNFKFKRKNADEETTIGYAANYAAKLQGLCNAGNIAISSNIFDGFSVDKKKKYVRCTSPKIQKYGEKCYYETSVSNLNGKIDYTESRRGGVPMKHIVITIGREYGSGGRLIAQRLAEELGVTFYDKQLIAEVAKRTGFSEHFVRDAEHQRPTNSFLYDLYCAVQTPSVPDQMFIAQAKVIKEAAARESCVIVGRCADYILREPYCLKTFVYAPLEQRVRRAREAYNVEQPNLESYVLRQDKARASYYNYFATGRWGDSREYDLCINSRIGIDAAVEVVKTAACGMAGE